MIRRNAVLLAVLLVSLALPGAAAGAQISFVPNSTTATALNQDGTLNTQAGAHPWSYTVHFDLATEGGLTIGGRARNIIAELPPGFVGNPRAVPTCPRSAFEGGSPNCPASSQVGVLRATVVGLGEINGPIYNLETPPGAAAQLAFSTVGFNALQSASLKDDGSYRIAVGAYNVPLEVTSATEEIWGVPADPRHFDERSCRIENLALQTGCYSDAPQVPFLTLPASCEEPLALRLRANSILTPDFYAEDSAFPADVGGLPTAFNGCQAVPFAPKIAAAATSRAASTPSGLDFELKLPNEGLDNPNGIAETEPEKVEVTLPEGLTANPSFAEGVSTCSEAQYGAERIDSAPGSGCPEASKLGSVIAHSPLLDEPIEGSLYLAAPYENRFNSLLAVYMALRAPERGVMVKQAGEVKLDPLTGQLKSTFEGLPPVPFSDFSLHFREGARAPLATPAACGEYRTIAQLYPFSAPTTPVERAASMQIQRGPDGGPCPSGGTPPFHPFLTAGSINNAAGKYSPFNTRITRTDSEQEITNFSIKLPPGITGKLAGIPFCSDAAIAAAKARTGPHGGEEEINSPSCPKASEVGRSLAGAGVGSALAYAPGKLYLAGPYHGSQLSLVSITAGKVGPFDLGNVVVRFALKINPETAEVFVDATGSDPIPHIIKGVPVHLRDIRAYVDRPDFVLNPTSCTRTSTASTVLGSGTNFASAADDVPVTVTSPFQAADCASLGFGPKLALSLKGGTKRGDTPALKAVLTARKGDANIGAAQITLPHSEFLEQAHIKTICTRVQFKEGTHPGEKCPAASIYGYAKAITPLLDDPIQGPVYLRSSSHPLPDLVAVLKNGQIDINLVGRIDSVGNGQIRNTFEEVPDAPVTKFTLEMQGGKKGLLVNSTNLCKRANKAIADFTGQNGKKHVFNPVVKPQGCKAKAKKKPAKRQKRQASRLALSAW